MALGFRRRGQDTGGWFPALQQLSFATSEKRVKISLSSFYMELPIQSPARYQSDIIQFSAFLFSPHAYIWVELELIISALLGPPFDCLSHFCFQGKRYQEVWCWISADSSVSYHTPSGHQRAERTKQEQPLRIKPLGQSAACSPLPSPPCKTRTAGKRTETQL